MATLECPAVARNNGNLMTPQGCDFPLAFNFDRRKRESSRAVVTFTEVAAKMCSLDRAGRFRKGKEAAYLALCFVLSNRCLLQSTIFCSLPTFLHYFQMRRLLAIRGGAAALLLRSGVPALPVQLSRSVFTANDATFSSEDLLLWIAGCKNCGTSRTCPHGRRRSRCKPCGGSEMCLHGRRRNTCKPCGGSQICPHGRIRSRCKPCGGSKICPRGRVRSCCTDTAADTGRSLQQLDDSGPLGEEGLHYEDRYYGDDDMYDAEHVEDVAGQVPRTIGADGWLHGSPEEKAPN